MANHIFNAHKVKLDGNTILVADADGVLKVYNNDGTDLKDNIGSMSTETSTNTANLATESTTRSTDDLSLDAKIST